MLVFFGGLYVGAAERGNLERLRSQHDVHQAEAPPDEQGAAEQAA
jgi:hypothetical protein